MSCTDFEPGATTKARQRDAILVALKLAPLSTLDARDLLGIASPAPRIFELRKAGLKIATRRHQCFDAAGRSHRFALYVLEPVEQAE